MEVEIIEGWKDHLIRCPSQCSLKLKYNNRFFILYLRWRHKDPWSSDIIEYTSEKDWQNLGMIDTMEGVDNWYELDIKFFKEYELEDLKINAYNEAAYFLKSNC
jgi:hypothetical protein